jgi:hypothetical protein
MSETFFLNGDSGLISGLDNIMRKTSIRNKKKLLYNFITARRK